MQTIVNNATSTFASTVGFEISSVIDFMSDMILLVIGTGLGVLQSLLPWILALIAISIVIGLLYKGFQFFRR